MRGRIERGDCCDKEFVAYALLLEVKQAVSAQGKEAALPKGREFLVDLEMSFLVSAQVLLVFHFRLRVVRERTKVWNK